MSWTQTTELAPPKDEDVILLWNDGVQRIGQNVSSSEFPMYRCTLDFGDAHASVYPPDDYQPVAWTWLPKPPTETVK